MTATRRPPDECSQQTAAAVAKPRPGSRAARRSFDMRRTAARLLLAAGLAATLLLGFGLYYHHAINPAVIEEIRRAPDGAR